MIERYKYDFTELFSELNMVGSKAELISLGGEQSVYLITTPIKEKIIVKVWDIFDTSLEQIKNIKITNQSTLQYVKKIYCELPNLILDENSFLINLGQDFSNKLVTIQDHCEFIQLDIFKGSLEEIGTYFDNQPQLKRNLSLLIKATYHELNKTNLSLDLFGVEPNILITTKNEFICIDAHIMFCHKDVCTNPNINIMKALTEQTKLLYSRLEILEQISS